MLTPLDSPVSQQRSEFLDMAFEVLWDLVHFPFTRLFFFSSLLILLTHTNSHRKTTYRILNSLCVILLKYLHISPTTFLEYTAYFWITYIISNHFWAQLGCCLLRYDSPAYSAHLGGPCFVFSQPCVYPPTLSHLLYYLPLLISESIFKVMAMKTRDQPGL